MLKDNIADQQLFIGNTVMQHQKLLQQTACACDRNTLQDRNELWLPMIGDPAGFQNVADFGERRLRSKHRADDMDTVKFSIKMFKGSAP